ncbi:hypothetical protein DSO57_1022462 [Entomophthora muscae]|uniref:Uncharacterized protein n=1 Tax=Entomophthora muscae TaxID=34485 RepID=A0ACC2U259_9FUNG|nr:hypothetical protein DSO57_1022462 [Entomophthora muscae]
MMNFTLENMYFQINPIHEEYQKSKTMLDYVSLVEDPVTGGHETLTQSCALNPISLPLMQSSLAAPYNEPLIPSTQTYECYSPLLFPSTTPCNKFYAPLCTQHPD